MLTYDDTCDYVKTQTQEFSTASRSKTCTRHTSHRTNQTESLPVRRRDERISGRSEFSSNATYRGCARWAPLWARKLRQRTRTNAPASGRHFAARKKNLHNRVAGENPKRESLEKRFEREKLTICDGLSVVDVCVLQM